MVLVKNRIKMDKDNKTNNKVTNKADNNLVKVKDKDNNQVKVKDKVINLVKVRDKDNNQVMVKDNQDRVRDKVVKVRGKVINLVMVKHVQIVTELVTKVVKTLQENLLMDLMVRTLRKMAKA